MQMPKSKYEQTKRVDISRVKEMKSVQDVFSIVSIDESGIFELPEKKFSKLFVLSDINFAGVTDEEQKAIIVNFSKVLKSIPCRFSYAVANEYVDERQFHEKILYGIKGNKYDGLSRAFNQVIKEKVSDAKQGLYQTIYLTLTIKAEDMMDARSTFRSMESAIKSAFIGLGVNGIQGSVMRGVEINERMQLLFNLTHVGIASKYKFNFDDEVNSHRDWLNTIAPVSMCFENEHFTMNGHIGKVFFIDQYPKSLESDIISALSKINCTSFISVNNELLDIAAFKQEIARKYMAVGMKIENEKQRNRNNNDYLADASQKLLSEKEKLDRFTKDMDANDDHFFNSTLLIMVLAKDEEELTQIEEKVNNAASLKSLSLKPCFSKQREALNSVLPIGIQEFKRVVNLSSSCLAMLMPFKTQELNDEGGNYYGINQLSQNVIFADKKKLKNHNGMVFGQSGSGKSVFAKSDIISTFVQNEEDQIIIIDPQSEYGSLATVTDGTVISFDSAKEYYLNPLDVNFDGVDYAKLQEIIGEKADFIFTLISSCLKRDLNSEEQGVIDKVMERVYSENYSMRKRLNGGEEEESPYDAIVITPYGLFVVEVKNWGAEMYIDKEGILRREDQDIKYDLPGRMGAKEALLREYLGEYFPERYQGIVLFSNENAKVVDEYKKIPLGYGGGIVNRIREFNDGKVQITGSQIYEISDKIISHHKEQKAPCRVKCDEIVEDYALLMAAIEEAAEGSEDSIFELKHKEDESKEEKVMQEKVNIPYFLTKEYAAKQKQVEKVVIGVASVLAGFGLGVLATKSFLLKK